MATLPYYFKRPSFKTGFWVRLIGSLLAAHVIETLGREESVLTMLTKRFYYIDVSSGFVIAFVVWSVLALATQWLDARFDWDARPLSRLVLQLLLGLFLPALLVHFLTYLQGSFLVENSSFFTPTWPKYEFPVCVMIILLANAYYIAHHYYRKAAIANPSGGQMAQPPRFSPENNRPLSNELTVPSESPGKKCKQVVLITKGYTTIPLGLDKVAYLYREAQHNYVKTFDNEVYFLDASLDETAFFKANRRTIINFRACRSYSVQDHGKLEVILQPASDEPIMISQKVAPAFKEWLDR